jgi:ACS family glucarate transporter-like MFS transporter
LVNVDRVAGGKSRSNPMSWAGVKQLLGQRMLVGIYLGQMCITTLTYFFLTWFPIYLVQARHMSILKGGIAAALPALFGSIGGVLGGVSSDELLRRGASLTFARKAPIVAGMLLAVTIVGCNYTNTQAVVMVVMTIAFFGKGFGALGWAVIADTSPKQLIGLNGGLFNLLGNISGITTPIVIGYIVKRTGSFNEALLFVGAAALLAIFSYVVIVGDIKRLELPPVERMAT